HARACSSSLPLYLHDALPILALKAMVIDGRSEPIDNIDETTTVFLSEFTNPVIAALALTALLAAIMSSASSFITIGAAAVVRDRSEEHTSELQSRFDLVCRLL